MGAQAKAVASTQQPFHNLMLSLGDATLPPFDPNSPSLSLVPLVEPIRPFPDTYPSAYPGNIYGETPHTAMGSQISALVRSAAQVDYVTVHSVVGENGQGMLALRKGAVESVDGAGASCVTPTHGGSDDGASTAELRRGIRAAPAVTPRRRVSGPVAGRAWRGGGAGWQVVRAPLSPVAPHAV